MGEKREKAIIAADEVTIGREREAADYGWYIIILNRNSILTVISMNQFYTHLEQTYHT